MGIIKKYTAKDIKDITGDMKISPPLRTRNTVISIEAKGSGNMIVEMSIAGDEFVNIKPTETFVLPLTMVISDVPVGNMIKCTTTGEFESINFNI